MPPQVPLFCSQCSDFSIIILNDHKKKIMKYFLQVSFILLLLILPSVNFYSQNSEVDKANTLFQKFQENRKGNTEQKKIAYESAKELVEIMKTNHCNDQCEYIQFWLDKYEISIKTQFDMTDWKRFKICGFTFYTPKTLKNLNSKGIDSCVGGFEDTNLSIEIDYGWYSSRYKKYTYDSKLEFREETIEIDNKSAQLVTYIDGQKDAVKKYIAGLYLEVKNDGAITTALNMTTRVVTEKDLETAKQIFQTIKFQ